jgi:hypothetical protein
MFKPTKSIPFTISHLIDEDLPPFAILILKGPAEIQMLTGSLHEYILNI